VVYFELRQKIAAALNGAGDKLGEKGYKNGVAYKVSFGLYPAIVYVKRVAERLKGVKRNADRQEYVK
jgi:hypothetical protein